MTTTLVEYFYGVRNRLPEEAERVIRSLEDQGPMNKEELSLTAKVKGPCWITLLSSSMLWAWWM